jgi:hypothetical protein
MVEELNQMKSFLKKKDEQIESEKLKNDNLHSKVMLFGKLMISLFWNYHRKMKKLIYWRTSAGTLWISNWSETCRLNWILRIRNLNNTRR